MTEKPYLLYGKVTSDEGWLYVIGAAVNNCKLQ